MKKTRSPRSADHPHVDAGNRYARDVVAGKIPACKWVILACKRHLEDLESSKGHNYPYRFDAKAAEKWCKFIELLPHTKGEWARKGEKLRLEPWQCFKTICLFGWLRKQDGLRRFRKALILEPRKNAKSTWAAGVGLGMFTIDGDHGAEVYSGATTEKQAWEVFKPARLMAMKTPSLLSHYGITVNAKNIHRLGDGSKFEPLIGDPGDGASPSCAIVDEYHEHDTDRMVDTMETGMGAREQPLLLIITTAGDNLAGPCYAMVQDAEKVLERVIENDEFFALIYTVDKDDDWSSDIALRKANPNYDVSVKGEFLRARQRDAKQNPRKLGVFKTKHLNLWVQARNAYFDIQKWRESAKPGLKLEDFRGKPCKIGLDLASTIDIAAMELTFEHEGGYVRFGKYYLPEATIELPENGHYRGWRDAPEQWITQTDGDMIDYVTIRDDILGLQDAEGLGLIIDEIAFDPHQAHMMMAELREEGIPCIEVRPLVLNFSPAMKQMDGATYLAATETEVFNAGLNVGSLVMSSTAITSAPKMQSLALNITNNIFPVDVVGQYETYAHGLGRFELTGTARVVFESLAVYSAILSHEDVTLSFTLSDAAGNSYAFSIPKVKLLDGGPTVGGNGQAVILEVPIQAIFDATAAGSIKITRTPA